MRPLIFRIVLDIYKWGVHNSMVNSWHEMMPATFSSTVWKCIHFCVHSETNSEKLKSEKPYTFREHKNSILFCCFVILFSILIVGETKTYCRKSLINHFIWIAAHQCLLYANSRSKCTLYVYQRSENAHKKKQQKNLIRKVYCVHTAFAYDAPKNRTSSTL